jgi:hypothetical protein
MFAAMLQALDTLLHYTLTMPNMLRDASVNKFMNSVKTKRDESTYIAQNS